MTRRGNENTLLLTTLLQSGLFLNYPHDFKTVFNVSSWLYKFVEKENQDNCRIALMCSLVSDFCPFTLAQFHRKLLMLVLSKVKKIVTRRKV